MRPALGLHRLGVVLVAAAVLALATAMHVSPVMAVDPPVLTSLDPDSAPAYGAGLTLTVNGTGFVAGSTVLWNGSARTTYTVSTALVSGSAETVGLAVTAGLPAGASAVFNPATVSAGGSSSLTVATSGSTPPSTSTLTITGTAPSATHAPTVSLTVVAQPTIAVDDFANYRVFQRDIGGTSKSVTISGTYANMDWSRVEARGWSTERTRQSSTGRPLTRRPAEGPSPATSLSRREAGTTSKYAPSTPQTP